MSNYSILDLVQSIVVNYAVTKLLIRVVPSVCTTVIKWLPWKYSVLLAVNWIVWCGCYGNMTPAKAA